MTCKLHLQNGNVITLNAWAIVGSPKFAPELVNIVTLDDVMFDVGVRYLSLLPELYNQSWNQNYIVDYQRDIEPIIRRSLGYSWVAHVQSMIGALPFDTRDSSDANRANSRGLFWLFPQASCRIS